MKPKEESAAADSSSDLGVIVPQKAPKDEGDARAESTQKAVSGRKLFQRPMMIMSYPGNV